VQPLGGVAEVQFLGDGDKVAEVAKLHVLLDPAPVATMQRLVVQG
jgi:hypothetical protein